MRILLDDQPCPVAADTVVDAIAGAATQAETTGRIIVEVLVDGTAWSEDALANIDESLQADEVRMISADPIALVLDTWADAEIALNDIDTIQKEAAEALQSTTSSAGLNRLVEALQLWQNVQQALSQGASLLGVNLDAQTVKGRPTTDIIADLNDQLVAVRSALEASDPVGLADTLMYEMPETVAQWRDLLVHLQTVVQENANS